MQYLRLLLLSVLLSMQPLYIHSSFAAEDELNNSSSIQISFTSRLWYTFAGQAFFSSNPALQSSQENLDIPLAGGSVTLVSEALGGTAFSITVLYGEGDGKFTAVTNAPASTLIGKVDADRLDIEAIAQIPIGDGNAFVSIGGRYIAADADVSGTVFAPAPVGPFTATLDSEVYLAEAGFGVSAGISSDGRHRLFGNITGMLGHQDLDSSILGVQTSNNGIVLGFDTNAGYGFSLTENITFSARYRLFVLSDPDIDFKSATGVVHGPEVNLSFAF